MFFPYIDNNYFFNYPFIPANCDKPPTLYSILESIVNYGKEDKTKIKDLAKEGRTKIFDFEYPLSTNISKEDFECMILNHYLTRRIGFDTPTLFKIKLNVKLNEIMPMYNKMFDAIFNWNIFNDGEKTNRYGTDNRQITSNTETNNEKNIETNNESETTSEKENTSSSSNSLHNTSTSENILDSRKSDTPQDELDNVRQGKYVTEYNYNTNNAEDESNSTGTSSNTTNESNNSNVTDNTTTNSTETNNSNTSTNDDNSYNEIIEKEVSNKIEILKEMENEIKSIYTLIFNDLDILFYSII